MRKIRPYYFEGDQMPVTVRFEKQVAAVLRDVHKIKSEEFLDLQY